MHAYLPIFESFWNVCLLLNACVLFILWRGPEHLLWLLCLCWLLWSRQVTLMSHLYFTICIRVFQVECMIGVLCFSSIMLCLEHLVVYSYPEPQLGKCLAILGYYPNAAFLFWLWWFSKTLKINNLNESPGWNGWLVVDSWVATQDHVHLWWI